MATAATRPVHAATLLDAAGFGAIAAAVFVGGRVAAVAATVGPGAALVAWHRSVPGGLAIGVGMLPFDSFAFTEVNFIFWILLPLGASLLLDGAEDPR